MLALNISTIPEPGNTLAHCSNAFIKYKSIEPITDPVEEAIHKEDVLADPASTYVIKFELNADPADNDESLVQVPSAPVPSDDT